MSSDLELEKERARMTSTAYFPSRSVNFLLTDRELFFSFDVVMNTGSVLSEALCLALASPSHGRVVSSLVQPPGFKE